MAWAGVAQPDGKLIVLDSGTPVAPIILTAPSPQAGDNFDRCRVGLATGPHWGTRPQHRLGADGRAGLHLPRVALTPADAV